jgi:ADP-ribose pyrophosphatase YjhB (NUDIX family)
MLHLIPAPLHRALLRLVHALRVVWWRVAKPQVTGVSVIARDGEGRVLLVRHTYSSRHWSLPGGGLQRGELPADGAAREFAEELDCAIYALVPVGVRQRDLYGATATVHVFAGEVVDQPAPDRREVAEARFFAVDALPRDCSSAVAPCLAMLEQGLRDLG